MLKFEVNLAEPAEVGSYLAKGFFSCYSTCSAKYG